MLSAEQRANNHLYFLFKMSTPEKSRMNLRTLNRLWFCVTIPHLTLGKKQNGWSPYDRRVSAVAFFSKMLYGDLYFKIFFSFLLSAFGS